MSDPTTPRQYLAYLKARFSGGLTNAQALAVLTAFGWFTGTVDAAVRAGMPVQLASAYLLPLGILARLRLTACGWRLPGNRLAAPTDAAHWARPFERRMWEALETYIDLNPLEQGTRFNERLAAGDPAELRTALSAVQTELDIIAAEKADHCEPYFVPRRVGVVPGFDPICVASVEARRRGEQLQDNLRRRPAWPLLLGLLLIAAYAKGRRDERR